MDKHACIKTRKQKHDAMSRARRDLAAEIKMAEDAAWARSEAMRHFEAEASRFVIAAKRDSPDSEPADEHAEPADPSEEYAHAKKRKTEALTKYGDALVLASNMAAAAEYSKKRFDKAKADNLAEKRHHRHMRAIAKRNKAEADCADNLPVNEEALPWEHVDLEDYYSESVDTSDDGGLFSDDDAGK